MSDGQCTPHPTIPTDSASPSADEVRAFFLPRLRAANARRDAGRAFREVACD